MYRLVKQYCNKITLMICMFALLYVGWMARGASALNLGMISIYKTSLSNEIVPTNPIPVYLARSMPAPDEQTAKYFLEKALRWNDYLDTPRFYLAWINILDGRYAEAQSVLLGLNGLKELPHLPG
jgi:hypothetical protein